MGVHLRTWLKRRRRFGHVGILSRTEIAERFPVWAKDRRLHDPHRRPQARKPVPGLPVTEMVVAERPGPRRWQQWNRGLDQAAQGERRERRLAEEREIFGCTFAEWEQRHPVSGPPKPAELARFPLGDPKPPHECKPWPPRPGGSVKSSRDRRSLGREKGAFGYGVRDQVRQFKPSGIPEHRYSRWLEDVRIFVTRASPETGSLARKWMTYLCAYVDWTYSNGEPLTVEVLFDRLTIERYTAAMRKHERWSNTSLGSRRSELFRIAKRLSGPEARIGMPLPVGRSQPNKPYTPAEIATYYNRAKTQSTEHRRRNYMLLLALVLGAGLRTRELLALVRRDIRWNGRHSLIVTVRDGQSPPNVREVPVLDEWVADLAAAIKGMKPTEHVFRPAAKVGRNGVANFMRDLEGPTPTVQRLRTTWIVTHLSLGTHLTALWHAAGVQSAETLARLLQYAEPIDRDEAVRQLRGRPS